MINVEKIKPTGLFTNYIYKAIPLAFDESMSYYETLCGLLSYLKDTVIPTLNNNADAIIELQNLYEQLHDYVEHYFDNLDVQEEINNKLDEMVEDGTLQEIIASYLNSKAIFGYDTVASMKQATNLINGSYAQTLGFYAKNDGGSALYKIRNITNQDVVDGITIISLYDNDLIAELIINDCIHTKQFGCYGDNTHDDTENLQKAIDYASENNYGVVYVDNGIYKITDALIIKKAIKISGDFEYGRTNNNLVYGSEIKQSVANKSVFKITENTYGIEISKLRLSGTDDFTCNGIEVTADLFDEYIIDKIHFGTRFNKCIILKYSGIGVISNCSFSNNNMGIDINYGSSTMFLYNNFYNNDVHVKISLIDGCKFDGNWFESGNEKPNSVALLFQAPCTVHWCDFINNNFNMINTSVLFDGTTNITEKMSLNMLSFTTNRFSGSKPIIVDMKNESGTRNTNTNNIYRLIFTNCVFNNVTSGQAIDIDIDGLGLGNGWRMLNCQAYSNYTGGDTNMFTPGQSNTAITNSTELGYTTNGIIKFNPIVNATMRKQNCIYMGSDYKIMMRDNNNADWKLMCLYKGSTANRITNPALGDMYYDTTLNKPIWWNGGVWIDANGNNV